MMTDMFQLSYSQCRFLCFEHDVPNKIEHQFVFSWSTRWGSGYAYHSVAPNRSLPVFHVVQVFFQISMLGLEDFNYFFDCFQLFSLHCKFIFDSRVCTSFFVYFVSLVFSFTNNFNLRIMKFVIHLSYEKVNNTTNTGTHCITKTWNHGYGKIWLTMFKLWIAYFKTFCVYVEKKY